MSDYYNNRKKKRSRREKIGFYTACSICSICTITPPRLNIANAHGSSLAPGKGVAADGHGHRQVEGIDLLALGNEHRLAQPGKCFGQSGLLVAKHQRV